MIPRSRSAHRQDGFRRKQGPVHITRYGIIRGGVCDQAHYDRRSRQEGAQMALDVLDKQGCFTKANRGWQRIRKLPRVARKKVWEIGATYGAQVEVGWYRFMEMVERLHKGQHAFRRKRLLKGLKDVVAPTRTGHVMSDHVFQQRVADGDL